VLSYDELTSPERELWDAFPEGRRVDLRVGVAEEDRVGGGGRWGPGRTVRAVVIGALLLGANGGRPGAVAGLRLAGARISPDSDGPSLVASLTQAVDFDLTLARPPAGVVDLRGTQVSHLHDNEHSWPDVVELDGFVYGSVKEEVAGERREAVGRRDSVAHRVAWVRRSPGYSPQAYEQLASWYRKAGHDDARRVLLAKQRHRRRTLRPAARVWGHLLDVTVGYGYRPWLAGVWLLALTLLGTLAFGSGSPTAVKRGEGAPFQPLVHTLDFLVPIGGLGQRTAWYWTDDGLQWPAYLLIAFGWLLTTAVVAGVTRTLQKN